MNEVERRKLYLDRLLKHKEIANEKKFYAIQRLDLLVISISGAGIYTTFEMLKFFYGCKNPPEVELIKFSGFLFILAIIVNILSQWSGYFANRSEEESTEYLIDQEKGEKINAKKVSEISKKVEKYNTITHTLNIWSTLLMFLALSMLTVFSLATS